MSIFEKYGVFNIEKKKNWHFIQIVSEDNLNVMSSLTVWK